MVELLSERYLNGRRSSRLIIMRRVLEELYTRFGNLKDRYTTDYRDKLLNPIKDLMANSIDFVKLLKSYDNQRFPYTDYLKFGIERAEEVKKLRALIRGLRYIRLPNENYKMAFHNVPFNKIYDEGIVQVSNFTLNRRSKLFYDLRSTSTLYYDVVLPFHNKDYDPTSTECTIGWDLPFFFNI